MRRVHQAVTIYYAGRLFRLKPEQWQRLAPQIKGLSFREAATVGQDFLMKEGLLKQGGEDCRT